MSHRETGGAAGGEPGPFGEPPGPRPPMGRRVVYLDDDPAMNMVVTRVLQREGCEVAHFASADLALAFLRASESRIDVLITDYNMPEMNGIELAVAARAIRPSLPVVITTGLVSEEMRHLAAEAGVHRVVRKPDRVQDHVAAVRAILQSL